LKGAEKRGLKGNSINGGEKWRGRIYQRQVGLNYIVYISASAFLKIKGCYPISTAAYEVIECQTYVRSGYILSPAGFKVQTVSLTVVLSVDAVVDAPLELYDCTSCCSFAKSCWAPLRSPDWSA